MRPASIRQLETQLVRLAAYGGASFEQDDQLYLEELGVATPHEAGPGWMAPTMASVEHVFSAESGHDLLRKLAVRDPLYRLHLDLSICQTIHAVGVSERWSRFEELFLDDCFALAPRLLQLITLAVSQLDKSVHEISTNDWASLRSIAYGDYLERFHTWDRELWGTSKGPSELFSLLTELYIPISEKPVHFTQPSELLCQLVLAAKSGEGVHLADGTNSLKEQIQLDGVPVAFTMVAGSMFAQLVGPVSCPEVDYEAKEFIHSEILSTSAKSSQFTTSSLRLTASCSPDKLEGNALRCGVFSLELVNEWKDMKCQNLDPPWIELPPKEHLADIGKWVADSGDADSALEQLSVHPLYGFILQVFLIEALDRELGKENIVFALKANTKLDDVSVWAEAQIMVQENPESNLAGLRTVGRLDDVLSAVAKTHGLLSIVTPCRLPAGGPWSTAMALMNSVSLVDETPEWTLTLNPIVFDRLHRGTLMKQVIRGGRKFREQLLLSFRGLCSQREMEIAR